MAPPLSKVAGIFMAQSRSQVKMPAPPMDVSSTMNFFLSLSPTSSVAAAACPIAYGSCCVSIKYLRNSAVKISPRMTPPSVTTSRAVILISASGWSIQIPGIVNASPPATIAPADMAVWVTLISCRFVFPSAFRENMDTRTTNMIGHGRELSFSAMNMELMVRITLPIAPITRPLAVSCFSVISIVSLCN